LMGTIPVVVLLGITGLVEPEVVVLTLVILCLLLLTTLARSIGPMNSKPVGAHAAIPGDVVGLREQGVIGMREQSARLQDEQEGLQNDEKEFWDQAGVISWDQLLQEARNRDQQDEKRIARAPS